jgi:hypothetical protein
VGSVADTVKTLFSFLLPKSRKEELVAEHIIREHRRGRSLDEILNDAYVTNRLSSDKVERVLERSDVIHAIGDDMIEAHRAAGGTS